MFGLRDPILVARLIAVVETSVAFAAMHLAFRAFKRFTTWGQWELETGMNYSPGVAMIAIALAMITLRYKRSPNLNCHLRSYRTHLSSYGLTLRPFFPSLNAALACLVILGMFGTVVDLSRAT